MNYNKNIKGLKSDIDSRMRTGAFIHIVLLILEVIALIHDLRAFGLAMFKYYTIDSNVLQLVVSGLIVYLVLIKGEKLVPVWAVDITPYLRCMSDHNLPYCTARPGAARRIRLLFPEECSAD